MLTRENHQHALRLPGEKADMLHAQTAVFGEKEITNNNSNKPKKEKKKKTKGGNNMKTKTRKTN